MTQLRWIGLAALALLPLAGFGNYPLHLIIMCLLWGYVYTSWALMGVNPQRIFLITSALGGGLAGLAACLLVLQYDIHPAIGLSFGPVVFLVCVLGGLGNMIGGFAAAFLFAQFISVGGYFFHLEWGYVIAFLFFIAAMFWRPRGLFGGAS